MSETAELSFPSVVEVRDVSGRTVFEFDPATGKAVIHLPGAALHIGVVDGFLDIACDRDIRIRSRGTVEIAGKEGVRLAGGDGKFALDRSGAALEAPSVKAQVGEAEVDAVQISAKAKEARVECGKLEQVVGRWFQFGEEVYQRVEGFLHTRAGRIRTESAGVYLVQADRARLLAREEVQIQGESIRLG